MANTDPSKKKKAEEAQAAPVEPVPKKPVESADEPKKPKAKKAAPEQPQAEDAKEKEKSGDGFVDAIVEQFTPKKLGGRLTGILDKLKGIMRRQPDSKKPDPNSKVYQHSESRNEGKNDKTLDHAQHKAPDTGGPGQKKDVVNRYNAAARPPAASSAASAQPQQGANRTPTPKN